MSLDVYKIHQNCSQCADQLDFWSFNFNLKGKLSESLGLFIIQFYEQALAKSTVLLLVEIWSFLFMKNLGKILKFKYKHRSIFQALSDVIG